MPNDAAMMISTKLGAALVQVPAEDAAKAYLRDQLESGAVHGLSACWSWPMPPAIGEIWPEQGGRYAGVVRGVDGPDCFLIDCGLERRLSWDDAIAWVRELVHEGHRDLVLPFRRDQSVLFGNVPELYQKEAYWSAEQSASYSYCAWCQGFSYGGQDSYRQSGVLLARPVRRVENLIIR